MLVSVGGAQGTGAWVNESMQKIIGQKGWKAM